MGVARQRTHVSSEIDESEVSESSHRKHAIERNRIERELSSNQKGFGHQKIYSLS